MHLINWGNVTQPKTRSGLGICRSRESNISLLGKVSMDLLDGSFKLWANVVTSKYLGNDSPLCHKPPPWCSYSWKTIMVSLN